MIPIELREFDLSIERSGGPREIRRYPIKFWGMSKKLTSVELISLPPFHEAYDSRLSRNRNGEKETDNSFRPKFTEHRSSLPKNRRLKFNTTQGTFSFCKMYHDSRIELLKKETTEFKINPYQF